MSKLYAQPYDMDKSGFYFESVEEYTERAEKSGAEEFEIQFIDGEREDAALFKACGISQCLLEEWFDDLETLDDREKAAVAYLCEDLGYSAVSALRKYDDVSLYEGELKEAAEELFDECYLHEVPEHVRAYIDYDAFARDCELGGDMDQFEFAGTTYTCTNANGI